MLKPNILLLETESAAAEMLGSLLSDAGFEVQHVESVERATAALQSRAYSALVFDCYATQSDPTQFVLSARQIAEDTAIVCTAASPGLSLVLGVMRNGATDFVAKPYQAAETLERIRSAIARHRVERATIKDADTRATRAEEQLRSAEHQLQMLRAKATEAISPNSAFAMAVRGFADAALNTFTEMEKEHLEILRRSLPHEDPTAAARLEAHTRTFIAHHDPDFVRNIVRRGEQLKLEFKPPLTTGGEILDKIGNTPGEVIILGDELPDIPSQMVVETIQSQHPDVSVVYIEQWATANQSVTLFSGNGPAPVSRLMRNVADLVAILDLARERSQQALFSREFAERFRGKHEAFLRKYSEIVALADGSAH
jgi:DNA-binding NtrC family response regulator